MPGGQTVPASLPFQILLVLGAWYFAIYFVACNATHIWKLYALPYSDTSWNGEYFLLWLLGAVEAFRIYFGMHGNLTQTTSSVVFSAFLSILSIITFVFFVAYQTYVLRIESILGIIALVLESLQLFLAVVAGYHFSSKAY